MDNLADVYALINTLQYLQKAYIKDNIQDNTYAAARKKLLSQFEAAFRQVEGPEFPTVESFMETYKMDCPAALKVIKEGAVVQDDGNKLLVPCTEFFISILNHLGMNYRAKDELQPVLKSLCETMSGLALLPSNFEGKTRMKHWLDVMDPMGASDQLTSEQARQLQFDVDISYSEFKRIVHDN